MKSIRSNLCRLGAVFVDEAGTEFGKEKEVTPLDVAAAIIAQEIADERKAPVEEKYWTKHIRQPFTVEQQRQWRKDLKRSKKK